MAHSMISENISKESLFVNCLLYGIQWEFSATLKVHLFPSLLFLTNLDVHCLLRVFLWPLLSLFSKFACRKNTHVLLGIRQ